MADSPAKAAVSSHERVVLSYESPPLNPLPVGSRIEPMAAVALAWGIVPLPFVAGLLAILAGVTALRNIRLRNTFGVPGAIIGILLGAANIFLCTAWALS